ncbi:competence/damage-inducible protein A [Raineyella fluvialis]|uniref:Competence/damage-inducible protein A n=1 Tax=Raineyella fluvialis TaxID=2662261 RepID=A0A5Q2FC26_9ACTN|nr:molybdopterin-binding protein [Raineyella fluvialis]QGF24610.1 competence/damage-inducible protein A [Raineyella fluvialis]
MSNPTAAILVIGDEILSGRTRDENMYYLAGVLSAHGIDLREVRVVPDDQSAIVEGVNALRCAYEHVFTSGGIGPTHDDITADAIATAFGVPIVVDPEAEERIRGYCAKRGMTYTVEEQRMARIPAGATLITNELSGAPGFTVENVHVMAGVPVIFRAMVGAVLPGLAQGRPLTVRDYRVQRPESSIAGELRTLAESYGDLTIGSYPSMLEGRSGTTIVVRGLDADRVTEAISALHDAFPA